MAEPLDRLAQRVLDDPFFLAAPLAVYARSEGLDDAGLARALGCAVPTLTALRLCRRPDPEPPRFSQEIDHLAARFGLDATVLAEAVRRADALEALRDEDAAAEGTLIAARDRRENGHGALSDGDDP